MLSSNCKDYESLLTGPAYFAGPKWSGISKDLQIHYGYAQVLTQHLAPVDLLPSTAFFRLLV